MSDPDGTYVDADETPESAARPETPRPTRTDEEPGEYTDADLENHDGTDASGPTKTNDE